MNMAGTKRLADALDAVAAHTIVAQRDQHGWRPIGGTRLQNSAVWRLIRADLITTPLAPSGADTVPFEITAAGLRARAGAWPGGI